MPRRLSDNGLFPKYSDLNKILLAGKRRPRYRVYGCAYFDQNPYFRTASEVIMEPKNVNKNVAGQAMIPWQNREQWMELQLSIERICAGLGDDAPVIMDLVETISTTYSVVDSQLQALCEQTCGLCSDICCMRATVWYEIRDLLYLQLAGKALQENQVKREPDRRCCFLLEDGCSLSRDERPFICTWYICADQKALLKNQGETGDMLISCIEKIQESRKILEEKCFQAVLR